MATPTPWQVAGAGAVNPLQPTEYTTQVFSRGTEPWPYYTPPVPVSAATGSNVAAVYGVYGVNNGAPAGAGDGGSSNGGSSNGGSSGGGNAGPGTGTGGGSSGFGCCGG